MLTYIRRTIKTLRHILYIVTHINWFRFAKYCRREANVVVISNFLTSGRFSTEGLCWEFGYIDYFSRNGIHFEYSSLRKPHFGKIVYWSPEITTTPISLRNYPALFVHIAKGLESQGCRVFPNSYEISFLENKFFMYEQFKLRGIPHPATYLLSTSNPKMDATFNPNEEDDPVRFPVVWKGEHSSGSADIELLKSRDDLDRLLRRPGFKVKHPNLILQEFADIRKDLRVNVIGDEVVLCFWRLNKSEEWRPTASKFGSEISFENLPTRLYPKFIELLRKLNMDIGGFDVVFEEDDVEKPFRVLEVSPRYSPNPYADPHDYKCTYSEYKRKIFSLRSWAYLQTREIFKHASKYVDYTSRAWTSR